MKVNPKGVAPGKRAPVEIDHHRSEPPQEHSTRMEILAQFIEFLATIPEAATPEERAAAIREHTLSITEGMPATEATGTLDALAAEIATALDAQLDTDVTSDQALANLAALDEIAQSVRAVSTEIAADEAEREQRAQALVESIRGPQAAEGDDDGGEPADPDGDETETPAETEAPTEVPAEETETDVETEARVPVAASTRVEPTRSLRPSARRPAAVMPVTASGGGQLPADIADWGLTASANAPGLTPGAPIRTQQQLADAFAQAIHAAAGSGVPGFGQLNIASVGGSPEAVGYAPDRILDRDWRANHAKIEAVVSQAAINRGGHEAIAAAGGRCAPVPVRYDLPMLGDDDRPFRDNALVRFGVDRGGIRLMPPVLWDDMSGATDFWTNDEDIAAATDPDIVKPCLTMTCPEDEDYFVYAVTKCIEVGVFRSKFFPEQVEAWMRGAAIAGARKAEVQLINSVAAASTQVTAGQVLGTLPSVLAALDHATSVMRSSNRLNGSFPLRWDIPFWLLDQIRTDLARQLPGSGTLDEKYALAESQFNRWLAVRSVTPVLMLDGETGQMFNRQGDGPVQGWPSTVVTYLYPEGTHLFLDAGELNLGIYRDAGLIERNSFRIFSETFEGHAMHGVESWRYALDTCPDGSTSAAVDIDPCTSGS